MRTNCPSLKSPSRLSTAHNRAKAIRPSYRVGATRRQDMNQLYRECGTIFIVKTELVLKNKNFGKKMFPFVVTDFGEALDIDTLEDFVLAEKLMQRK
jgi:N-acylneuraminate cytidylyltransferase/CMP-N,N'-diacetyllegionaminic acid synthase